MLFPASSSLKSNEDVISPHNGFLQLSPTFLAFRSSEIHKLLSENEFNGGTDVQGLHPLFIKSLGKIISPKLAVMFHIFARRKVVFLLV